MAKNKISEFSSTPANNTDIGGIDIAEGCAPSGINNAIRELMAQLKDQQVGTDADNFTVGGNLVVTGTTTATALTTTGNTILGDASSDTLNVGNGGLVKDASGNVGVGTASPAEKLDVSSTGDIKFICQSTSSGFGSNSALNIKTATEGNWLIQTGNAVASGLRFSNTSAERMRISATGALYLNTTSSATINDDAFYVDPAPGYGLNMNLMHKTGVISGIPYIAFGYGGTTIGSIAQNGTTSVTYNTTSDYRLKENIAPMVGALSLINKLKPVTYSWKIDGSDGQGFIAHELAEVIPDCVTGEKDAIDKDGNPKYQGIDTSFLVATLAAGIQEQQAIIASLTSRLETLESK